MILKIDNNTWLELITGKHALQIYDLVSENRLYLRQWLPWVDNMKSVGFIENFVKDSTERNEAGNEFAFVIIENENMVGRGVVYKIEYKKCL